MSRTYKEGKRAKHSRVVHVRHADAFCAVFQRHLWGATEKILRRNRSTWIRLGNKQRRRNDRDVVRAAFDEKSA